jgi:hypothetical protein
MDELQLLRQEVMELRRELNSLKANTTIPQEIEQAFRARFLLDTYASLGPSSKTAASETQAVDEAGMATYSVAMPPNGFREFITGGTVLYIPYYT